MFLGPFGTTVWPWDTRRGRSAAQRSVVLEAVRQNGCALRFASEELRRDGEVVHAAVWQDGYALRYVPVGSRNDLAIVVASLRTYGLALRLVG